MRRFGIVLFLFTVMAYAQAPNDPCAKFTSQQEKNVCNNMMPGLNAYRNDLTKQHAMPLVEVPPVPGSDVGGSSKTIKLPPAPGQEDGVTIQQHRNIFQ